MFMMFVEVQSHCTGQLKSESIWGYTTIIESYHVPKKYMLNFREI